MTRIAILSDTHVYSDTSTVPDWVCDLVREADHVIHAGDFVTGKTVGFFEELAGPGFTAVRGNADDYSVDLPRVVAVVIESITFVVTHPIGIGDASLDRDHYERMVAGTARRHATTDDVVGIAGHTHNLIDKEVNGVRLLNPGSATGALPASTATMLTGVVDGDDLTITVHEEPPG